MLITIGADGGEAFMLFGEAGVGEAGVGEAGAGEAGAGDACQTGDVIGD